MKRILLVLAFLVFLAVASASTERKIALKTQKIVAKQTIHDTCANVATSVCSNHDGKNKVDCHERIKKTVKKYLKKVKKTADKAIKGCKCTEKASHKCTESDSATEVVTQCKSDFVKVCSKDCLSTSKTYRKTIAKKTKKLLKRICSKRKDEENCKKAVKSHCAKAVHKLKNVAVKIVQVKVHHKRILSKTKVEKKIKRSAIKKHKKELRTVYHRTCNKVAKIVCAGTSGEAYVNCHKNTVSVVKHFLKKVARKSKQHIKHCHNKTCARGALKLKNHSKSISEIISLCHGNEVCKKRVQKHCVRAVKKVKKVISKIHIVKTGSHLHKKIRRHHNKNIKKIVRHACDKITKYVCKGKTGRAHHKCHKKVVKTVKRELKKIQRHTKKQFKRGNRKIVHKKIIRIVNLCKDEECRTKVQQSWKEIVTKINKIVFKLHELKQGKKFSHKRIVDHNKSSTKKVKRHLIRAEKKHGEKVVKRVTNKVISFVCAKHHGKHNAKCHQRVKRAVRKFYKKIQKQTKKVLKSCACEVKATHHCITINSGFDTVTACQSEYIKECSKSCLSEHKKKVEEKAKKLIKKICRIGKHSGNRCIKKVQRHCDKVIRTAKKVQIKVHIVKKVNYPKKVLIKKISKTQKKLTRKICN